MMIRGYVFDMGDTLVDNSSFHLEQLFACLEIETGEKLKNKDQVLKKLLSREKREISFDKLLKLLGLSAFSKETLEITVCKKLTKKPFLNAKKFFLKTNKKIFVLSNSLFSGKALKCALENLGFKHDFVVFSSSDLKFRKPYSKIYLRFLKKIKPTGLEGKDLCFFGNDFVCDELGPKKYFFKTCCFSFKDKMLEVEDENS